MINTVNIAEAAKLTQWLNPPQPTRPLARYRLTLARGETYTFSSSTCEVCILSGVGCILDNECEVILIHGEKRSITAEQGDRRSV